MEHVAQTKVAQVTSDVTAAINHLKNRDSYENRSIFTLGFCFGGSSSWLQAAGQESLSGSTKIIYCYGIIAMLCKS